MAGGQGRGREKRDTREKKGVGRGGVNGGVGRASVRETVSDDYVVATCVGCLK